MRQRSDDYEDGENDHNDDDCRNDWHAGRRNRLDNPVDGNGKKRSLLDELNRHACALLLLFPCCVPFMFVGCSVGIVVNDGVITTIAFVCSRVAKSNGSRTTGGQR